MSAPKNTDRDFIDEPTCRCHQNPFIGALGIQEPVILREPKPKTSRSSRRLNGRLTVYSRIIIWVQPPVSRNFQHSLSLVSSLGINRQAQRRSSQKGVGFIPAQPLAWFQIVSGTAINVTKESSGFTVPTVYGIWLSEDVLKEKKRKSLQKKERTCQGRLNVIKRDVSARLDPIFAWERSFFICGFNVPSVPAPGQWIICPVPNLIS